MEQSLDDAAWMERMKTVFINMDCRVSSLEAAAFGKDNAPLLSQQHNEDVASLVAKYYGTPADDKNDKNEKLDDFIASMGSVNFYTLAALMVLDPKRDFQHYRSQFKMFLLPALQIGVPFGMCWYFVIQEQLLATNDGYCVNHTNFIFRFTGFATFVYSAWQIIDGCDDESAKYLLNKAVTQWSITGRWEDLKASFLFYLGYGSQQMCSMLLLLVIYVIYTTQCDTPLDLLMNCVAVNFVLDIDSEWVSDAQQEKAQLSGTDLFKRWRDTCVDNEAEITKSLTRFKSVRRSAPEIVTKVCRCGDLIIMATAYFFVFGWTFCPAGY